MEKAADPRFEKMLKRFMKKSNESKKALRQREERKQGMKPKAKPQRRNEQDVD